ncbi:DinB family protein [Alicyclobacillus sp. SP_1]|uniref:DinB family protein n=1 Tax=Alicyclobacillus sp. SP_1 TaxID=2942475 RepID=UPI00215875BF|nr:DinB family protein [Alicyclobacillus sp. SP_1]
MTKVAPFADAWLRHRLITSDILDGLTDDHALEFKPWDGAMSLRELVVHMLVAADMFTSTIQNGSFSRPNPDALPKPTTLAELRAATHDFTNRTKDQLASISDETYDKMIDTTQVFGQPLPAHALLGIMKDHEIHHKGQLFVYGRMLGMEKMPPIVRRTI